MTRYCCSMSALQASAPAGRSSMFDCRLQTANMQKRGVVFVAQHGTAASKQHKTLA